MPYVNIISLAGVSTKMLDASADVEMGRSKGRRKMGSAAFSISYNFIPNGDMFGILDNISEFAQKSIMSS